MSEPLDEASSRRHRDKMQKRKAAQDAEVAGKTIAGKGLLIVHTGAGKPQLIEAADLVTEMALVRHHFAAGVRAQQGVEF
ncbi:MAG: cob(I)yrinic acid a,c-diamide adenosyltransferase [Methylocella sp.]